ncbi:hypothetical protein [Oceanobacillus alkalisoli]|uniref:hypothetical protein n=1 Tax=Oceanobacillus alkalisoli TaxID=2925113 RepID=UPI001EE3F662|nr:hypothetical protein [Oceanobacillus alkalisoli]MCG5102185.1 hypothetical protein [Oceanobacillus alkalisoli]
MIGKVISWVVYGEDFIKTESPLWELNYEIFIQYQTKATLSLLQYWIKSKYANSKAYMMEQLTCFPIQKLKV